jgi:hypothetical protein
VNEGTTPSQTHKEILAVEFRESRAFSIAHACILMSPGTQSSISNLTHT